MCEAENVMSCARIKVLSLFQPHHMDGGDSMGGNALDHDSVVSHGESYLYSKLYIPHYSLDKIYTIFLLSPSHVHVLVVPYVLAFGDRQFVDILTPLPV